MQKRKVTNDEWLYYISRGESCPYCDGDYVAEEPMFDFRIKCICAECKAEWFKMFEFTHIREIQQ